MLLWARNSFVSVNSISMASKLLLQDTTAVEVNDRPLQDKSWSLYRFLEKIKAPFFFFFIVGNQGRLETFNLSFAVHKLQSINRVIISAYKGEISFLPLQESEQFSS